MRAAVACFGFFFSLLSTASADESSTRTLAKPAPEKARLTEEEAAERAPSQSETTSVDASKEKTVDSVSAESTASDANAAPAAAPGNLDFLKAVALQKSGEYAEAATLFDEVYAADNNLAALLRAGIAWYQGGFFAAAAERFTLWQRQTDALGESLDEGIARHKPVVESLLGKSASKVFEVSVELPEDVCRRRDTTVSVSVSKLAEGFVPPPKTWTLGKDRGSKTSHTIKMEAGRWLFEIQSPLYEDKAEVIEVLDDSPLILSPIPSAKMPASDAPTDERIAYREALDQFRAFDFTSAVRTMVEMVPAGLVTEEALWLFARSNELGQNWTAALRGYQRLLERHPSSPEVAEIKTKLNMLQEKSEASRAAITLELDPPTSQLTLVQDGQKQAYQPGQTVYPGFYEVYARWPSGAKDKLKIEVKPKQAQVFKLKSSRAYARLQAMRWSIDGLVNLGFATVSGNQSETVTVGGGMTTSIGIGVGWLWTDAIRFESGLLLQYAEAGFEVTSGGGFGAGDGSWTFYHVALPIGATWISAAETSVSAGIRLENLVYASERLFERSVNISGEMRALNLAPYVGVRHPITALGRRLDMEVQYVRQSMPLTASESTLRLQQLTFGLSTQLL